VNLRLRWVTYCGEDWSNESQLLYNQLKTFNDDTKVRVPIVEENNEIFEALNKL